MRSLTSRPETVLAGIAKLRRVLDARIFGQTQLKDALVLGLVSKEHVYVEGPPGAAKTLLAERTAELTQLRPFVYQMHRDTRLHEIVGDAVILRQREADGTEVIRQSTRPGGILSAQIAVLDDISRAPGEALNVLFRILNERRFAQGGDVGSLSLPLISAIATGNPIGADEAPYYGDALDPASLDRFTLQVRSSGLISGGSWDDVARVIAMHDGDASADPFSPEAADAEAEAAATAERLREAEEAAGGNEIANALLEAHSLLPSVRLTGPLRTGLLELVQRLTKEVTAATSESLSLTGGASPHNAAHSVLLTDRTFLAKAPLLCRAHALVHGRQHCILDDLHAVRHMTAFRVPLSVHQRIDALITEVIENVRRAEESSGRGSAAAAAAAGQQSAGDGSTQQEQQQSSEQQQSEQAEEASAAGAGGSAHSGSEEQRRQAAMMQEANGSEHQQQQGQQHSGASSGRSNSSGDMSMMVEQNHADENESRGVSTSERDEAAARQRKQQAAAPAAADQRDVGDLTGMAILPTLMMVGVVGTVEALLDSATAALANGTQQKKGKNGLGPKSQQAIELEQQSANALVSAIGSMLDGRSRKNASLVTNGTPAGTPASWRPPPSIAELHLADVEPVAAQLWMGDPTPRLPNAIARRMAPRGGRVAILRDVSASMEGDRAAWASAVVAQLVELCRRKKLAVGYLEFNHEPLVVTTRHGTGKPTKKGARSLSGSAAAEELFTYDYARVQQLAARKWSGGGTDLQRALKELIDRYAKHRPPAHLASSMQAAGHALLVTDGVQEGGQPMLEAERAQAKAMGLCVHTVFINSNADEPYPASLAALAAATGGMRFSARVVEGSTNVRLSWRDTGELGWESV